MERGHSRVPVYFGPDRHIVGVLLVKHLLAVDLTSEEAAGRLRDLPMACMRQ